MFYNLLRKLHLIPLNILNNQKLTIHKWTSASVRESFISFYKENDHTFIPSSPVVPWSDSSLEFVNAGMNQFKSSILGQRKFPTNRAANSQKCIRVGGKHNDLQDVGKDTYHHTFFEMLGNWSFNDYFKEEACKMSWKLLTEVYKIPHHHLYVTYFGGDTLAGIGEDKETKNIWLSIGVPKERIIACGMKDNFWEMGNVGPCGVSTEIHYEREPSENGALKVNTGSEDVIEIWNIVFIQYQKLESGELVFLENKFVDTGMGLERITACLNGVKSNYDTDLFIPLFNEIEKISGMQPYRGTFNAEDNCIDAYYRILADHSRMVSIALADGFLPQECDVLRKLTRKCFLIGWKNFNLHSQKNFMETLLRTVSVVLDYEEEHFRELQLQLSKDWPLLIESYPFISNITNISPQVVEVLKYMLPNRNKWTKELPLEEALEIVEENSLSENAFLEIVETLGLNLNFDKLHTLLNEKKMIQRDSTLKNQRDYSYEKHNTLIQCIISEDNLVKEIHKGDKCVLILESSIFYPTSGGQICDKGLIDCDGNKFKVSRVEQIEGFILHYGEVIEGSFNTGNSVELSINKGSRLNASKLHTAHHLLRGAIEFVAGMAFQNASSVTDKSLTLQVFVHPLLTFDQLLQAEDIVKTWIKEGKEVCKITLPLMEALRNKNLTLLSGAKYPEEVNVISTELDFPSEIKENSKGNTSITAVIGKEAEKLNTNGKILENEWKLWEEKVTLALSRNDKLQYLNSDFKKWKNQIKKSQLPATIFHSIEEKANNLIDQMKEILVAESNWKELHAEFVEHLKTNSKGSIIYDMNSEYKGPLENLETIIKEVSGRPAMFVCKGWGRIRACVYLPKEAQTYCYLEELLEEIQLTVGKGDISISKNSEEIGFFYLNGVKWDQVQEIRSSIINVCREKLNTEE
ncbi:Alanine--tRNA ligase, cytoplasmic [Armadillidium nasatum]|uniref:alanine--tRNA ligase n=1 Tax=Armadillidium nasatum TaxID=96803 RepID=A0A5N5TLR2_9CRUS|nr:Alanine--tRNA ligase, cytoplasmic [Armadillidium nasatum]